MLKLSAEDLLSGSKAIHDLKLPPELLGGQAGSNGTERSVQIRPLTMGTFQLIMKAGREDPGLIPLLMVKECLAEPVLTMQQVRDLPLGLVEYLVVHIRNISGLTEKKTF